MGDPIRSNCAVRLDADIWSALGNSTAFSFLKFFFGGGGPKQSICHWNTTKCQCWGGRQHISIHLMFDMKEKKSNSIHPFTSTCPYRDHGGLGWSLSQLPLDNQIGRQSDTGLTLTDGQPHTVTFTPMGHLESPVNPNRPDCGEELRTLLLLTITPTLSNLMISSRLQLKEFRHLNYELN